MGILDFWLLVKTLSKRVLLLTGNPGVGKTTVLTRTVEALKRKGFCVGGMISKEVRDGSSRVGFEIIDLTDSKKGWLAHISQKNGPRVGKYRVNLENLNAVGANAIAAAVEKCDVVAIDEIGPMELFSAEFKGAAIKALESKKLVIAVVHWKAHDKVIDLAKNREDAELFTLTFGNREQMPVQVVSRALEFLSAGENER